MDVKRLQDAVLEIYEIFRNICEGHGVKYCASFGTALGAVRHNGFIPWDDDLDVEMLREEYVKFQRIAETELPSWLRLMSWQNTAGYTNLFSKLICTDAKRVEDVEKKAGIKLTQGLFIDIFIVDRFPASRWAQVCRIIQRGIVKLWRYSHYDKGTRSLGLRMCCYMARAITCPFTRSLRTCYDALKEEEEIIISSSKKRSSSVWISCWQSCDWKNAKRRFGLPESNYKNVRHMKFGPTSIPVVSNFEEYLSKLYGDWRTMPPVDQRVPTHANKAKLQQWRLGYVCTGKKPLLSIVIANYNYGMYLDDAISSIIKQTCGVSIMGDGRHVLSIGNGDFIEVIVCDGGSSDNSVEIIKKYNDYIAWWCSEHDGGQSDAFNKGFARSCGRFLTWLNADDVLIEGALLRFSDAVRKNDGCQWFAGGCLWLDSDMNVVSVHRARRLTKYLASCGTIPVYSPSSFFTKELLDSVGGVNVSYHYKMDRLLWSQFYYDKHIVYRKLNGLYFGLRMHPGAKVSGVAYYGLDKDGEETPSLRKNREEREALAKIYPRKTIRKWPQIFAWDSYLKIIDYLQTIVLRGRNYYAVKRGLR